MSFSHAGWEGETCTRGCEEQRLLAAAENISEALGAGMPPVIQSCGHAGKFSARKRHCSGGKHLAATGMLLLGQWLGGQGGWRKALVASLPACRFPAPSLLRLLRHGLASHPRKFGVLALAALCIKAIWDWDL